MKKVLLSVFVGMLCACPMASHAEGIKAGDQMVSVFLGGAAPLQDSNISAQDVLGATAGTEKLDWGGSAVSYGLQYMYSVTDSFAFGLEYMGNSFSDADYDQTLYVSPSEWAKASLESSMEVHNLMAAGRFTTNPDKDIRFYIPFGLGVAFSKATLDLEETLVLGGRPTHNSDSVSADNTSFAYYLGLGVEGNFSNQLMWGVEGRYSAFTMDYGKFDGSDYGKEDLSYFSLLFKLSYKF